MGFAKKIYSSYMFILALQKLVMVLSRRELKLPLGLSNHYYADDTPFNVHESLFKISLTCDSSQLSLVSIRLSCPFQSTTLSWVGQPLTDWVECCRETWKGSYFTLVQGKPYNSRQPPCFKISGICPISDCPGGFYIILIKYGYHLLGRIRTTMFWGYQASNGSTFAHIEIMVMWKPLEMQPLTISQMVAEMSLSGHITYRSTYLSYKQNYFFTKNDSFSFSV